MNNKRQTRWLVSMLSLMVILFAYYLFTEDSGPVNPPVADSQQVDGMKQGEAKETAGILDPTEGLVVNEVVNSGEITDDSGALDPAGSPADVKGQESPSGEGVSRVTGEAPVREGLDFIGFTSQPFISCVTLSTFLIHPDLRLDEKTEDAWLALQT